MSTLWGRPALPVTTRFVAKRTLFWIPVLGQAMGVAGFIPIDRRDRESAIATQQQADLMRAEGRFAEVAAFYMEEPPEIEKLYELTSSPTNAVTSSDELAMTPMPAEANSTSA